ncbi:MATE family efflux transporter [Motilimonas eburnea]|uniref:MATE family efflux transporter n=1 Tax=Motilimonas eburnea TaxID=1737488 RepID=UPI001E4C629B|nr:MATE family efflux transporter [Motilimonas eburnea]MCE2573407.1 MATE family efflux transporter [Motilimonas eburnea]
MSQAKFVKGSIFKHILVMSSTNAIGLTALFLVDLIDLFFISLLGEVKLAAAIGYAGTLSFFTTSIAIGISIAMSALVSRSIGQKNREQARRFAINVAVFGFLLTSLFSAVMWYFVPELLRLLGATGDTLNYAISYLRILVPSLPFLCLAMNMGAALRGVGDAKKAMYSTLTGGAVNAIFDPLFIFALGLGLEGAAMASVMARFAVLAVGFHGAHVQHRLIGRFHWRDFKQDIRPIVAIAGPGILTNIATPFGNAYVTSEIAQFGDGYVAGWAVVGRVLPVAFGMIFALSGAIGPIIGQNYGANLFDRVRATLNESLKFVIVYVLTAAMCLAFAQDLIIAAFGVGSEGASIVRLFCQAIAVSFVFSGGQFIANASFNNLGFASYSTLLNVGKSTLGTIPFVYLGALWYGPSGVLYGQALGTTLFGITAVLIAYRLVAKIERDWQVNHAHPAAEPKTEVAVPLSPYSSSRVYLCNENQADTNEVSDTVINK